MNAQVTLLGVRHHGPGSARAVAAALAALRPDAVLIEGPPEADELVAAAAEKEMVPPVALLAHVADDPARAAFWPFAAFSPEWVALRYALDAGVPVRFIDLPAAQSLALGPRGADDEATGPFGDGDADRDGVSDGDGDETVTGNGDTSGGDGASGEGEGAESGVPGGTSRPAPVDPIAELAAAAGHPDPESWWEDAVEHRTPDGDPLAPFAALAEAMAALREHHPAERRDLVREAAMRQQLRAARRAGHRRIAVVCGAWHVPALATLPTVAHDRALLAELPRKLKAELTWVPWTHRRLSQHTGYGAGIDSPGWYHHLFTAPEQPVARWMARVAELLRAEDHPVSSAHVIEAIRLAETLAAVRGRPLPGLTETLDAVRAVMCDGSDVALALVRERLVVGDALGEVPDGVPAVPLQRDLTRLQRTLRLKPEAAARDLVLDLRKDLDVERSRLLHRLRLLGLHWGRPSRDGVHSTGTFRETWQLCWEPEFSVRLVEAGQWGTTVRSAATHKAVADAATAELTALTALAEQCLLADLPDALPEVMRLLADRAALDTDAGHLAAALPALVRTLRYGDVRATDTSALTAVAHGLAERLSLALPAACTGLDADGATARRAELDAVHQAIALLGGDTAGRWAATLAALAAREPHGGPATGVPGLLRGRAVRLLLDDGRLDAEEAGRRLGLVLSTASDPADAGGWVEGFVSGGGALLLHDPTLLGLLDTWLCGVSPDAFTDLLPVLRRTFSSLETGVRHTIGSRVAAGPLTAPAAGSAPDAPLDEERAEAATEVLALLLGVRVPPPRIPRQVDRRAG
ncbi:hypothetical protein K353_04034 [Kitasatospora sp. SolWspMP-SS2h]|uniref:DUF5682 family protein n=1 Tax=Kitasatospora sp. SolWspMP-SS2h TaxID=1305729 RepID=UPI000DB9A37C|nr:DUF5682 family protein [Kitasatospora sp. SolWspMP-SS2h]RAJ38934.1 hypothetical protein K353_04034 [Kitasatospora sp. SolWspMP-SS2h]